LLTHTLLWPSAQRRWWACLWRFELQPSRKAPWPQRRSEAMPLGILGDLGKLFWSYCNQLFIYLFIYLHTHTYIYICVSSCMQLISSFNPWMALIPAIRQQFWVLTHPMPLGHTCCWTFCRRGELQLTHVGLHVRYGGFHKWGIPNSWLVYYPDMRHAFVQLDDKMG